MRLRNSKIEFLAWRISCSTLKSRSCKTLKNFTSKKLSKWLTTSTRESSPSCQKSQNNKRTMKSDSSRKSKTKLKNSASSLKKSPKTKSNVICSYRIPEKLTLSFPLTPNSTTSSKTGKQFPVPFHPSNKISRFRHLNASNTTRRYVPKYLFVFVMKVCVAYRPFYNDC